MKYVAYVIINIALIYSGGYLIGSHGTSLPILIIGLLLSSAGSLMIGIAIGNWSILARKEGEK